jgi:hypothetical protein
MGTALFERTVFVDTVDFPSIEKRRSMFYKVKCGEETDECNP